MHLATTSSDLRLSFFLSECSAPFRFRVKRKTKAAEGVVGKEASASEREALVEYLEAIRPAAATPSPRDSGAFPSAARRCAGARIMLSLP